MSGRAILSRLERNSKTVSNQYKSSPDSSETSCHSVWGRSSRLPFEGRKFSKEEMINYENNLSQQIPMI